MSQSDSNDGSRFLINSSQGPRSEQQDSGICLHDDAQGTALLVVGDGVGGRSGGRIASQKVTALAAELWEERKGRLEKPAEDLALLCQIAHEHINTEGSKLGISPRTTIVALYLTPTQAWWVHSGDSRLYHFRAGELVERTEDHSLLEIMVQRGAVKEEDMGKHPDQNTLLQSLGGEEFMPPSSGTAEINAEDGFLLCTDGFWERTKLEEMAPLVFADLRAATGLLAQAVERAIVRNGPKGDNVTVAVALPARVKPAVRPAAATLTRQQTYALITGAILLLVVAPALFFWPEEKKPAAGVPAVAPESPLPVVAPAQTAPAVTEAPPPPPPPGTSPGQKPATEVPIARDETAPKPRAAAEPAPPTLPPPNTAVTPAPAPASAGPTPIVPPQPSRSERFIPNESRKPKPADRHLLDSPGDIPVKPAQ